MKIDTTLLDSLTAQAKASPRLRMNMDLRNGPEDQSQRMLNAMEPGTVVPIHRHSTTSETFLCVRGKARVVFFDENGTEVESVVIAPCGDCPIVQVESGCWHTAQSLESGTIICEMKDGKYDPNVTEEYMPASRSNRVTECSSNQVG